MTDNLFTQGSSYRLWIERLTRGGQTYDLSTATVTFLFHKPDGSILERAGHVQTAAQGTVYCDVEAGMLDSASDQWSFCVKVVDTGGVSVKSTPQSMDVVGAP